MYIFYTKQFSVLPRDTELTQGRGHLHEYGHFTQLYNPANELYLFSELLLQRYLCFWILVFDKKKRSFSVGIISIVL